MSTKQTNTWEIVTTAKETADKLLAFVTWHLGAGASRITIYFDDPHDINTSLFKHIPQVRCIVCDDYYWQNYGATRPTGIRKRQIYNANQAYKNATSAWILHCDVDEFIHSKIPIDSMLANTPNNIISIQIPPLERIFSKGIEGDYGDIFRKRSVEKYPLWQDEIFNHPELLKFAMVGHVAGKSFVRCNIPNLKLHVHQAKINGDNIDASATINMVDDIRLLHFFCSSFEHFREKGSWKFARQKWHIERDKLNKEHSEDALRRMAFAEPFESNDHVKQEAIFDDLFVFDDARLMKLEKFQKIICIDFTKQLGEIVKQ